MGARCAGAACAPRPPGRDRRAHRAGRRVPPPGGRGSRGGPPLGGIRARSGARRSPASPARASRGMDLERVPAEGAGVAAAGVVETAAALVAVAAGVSTEWAEAGAVAGQAAALRRRAERLAVENAAGYADVLRALEQGGD